MRMSVLNNDISFDCEMIKVNKVYVCMFYTSSCINQLCDKVNPKVDKFQ